MPLLPLRDLLRPKVFCGGQPDSGYDKVGVVCAFGGTDVCYTIDEAHLVRLLNTDNLRPAEPAKRYAVLMNRSMGKGSKFAAPIEDTFKPSDLNGSGLSILYVTAGRYRSKLCAMEEFMRLPKKAGRSERSRAGGDEDEDGDGGGDGGDGDEPELELREDELAECLGAGAPAHPCEDESNAVADAPSGKRAKRAKRGAKGKAGAGRRAKPKPSPENEEYRSAIVREQQASSTRFYSVNHLGAELCTVLAQMLRCLEDDGCVSRKASVFMYACTTWKRRVREQAKQAGNFAIAAAASRRRGQSLVSGVV